VGSEDVEDHTAAIKHLDAQFLLKISDLSRGEFVVKHDHIGWIEFKKLFEFLHLTLTERCRDIWSLPLLCDPSHDICTSSVEQEYEFVQVLTHYVWIGPLLHNCRNYCPFSWAKSYVVHTSSAKNSVQRYDPQISSRRRFVAHATLPCHPYAHC
jgi:hypothetical protein